MTTIHAIAAGLPLVELELELEAEARALLDEQTRDLLLRSPLERYCPHPPSPKQTQFLQLQCDEAFYGGAAGGGKSDALLMAALQYVHVPQYAALIVRRSFSDLSKPGALMPRAEAWFGPTDARWSQQDKTWHFPSGATITFGYMDTENDRFQYQSSEFQFVGFDEVTQFTELQYRYVGFSRRRRLEGSSVPLRTRAASNPDGVGFEWVKQRFVTEADPETRPFVAAELDDNPGLDKESYRQSLDHLDPVTRARLLNGDWDVRAGGNKFKREWFEIVDAAPVDARRVRYWDLAATEATKGRDPDYTVGCRMSKSREGVYYVEDVVRMRGAPGSVEAQVKQSAQLDGLPVTIFMEQEPGASGKNSIETYRRHVVAGYAFYGIPSTGSKEIRANPLSSQAEAGNVKLVRGPWIGAFLDELCGFPDVAHDDQVDAASGAFQQLALGRQFSGLDIDDGNADRSMRPELAGVRRRDF